MPRITEMYAYVMADTDPDDEGIPAFTIGGVTMPMVGADLARAAALRPHAVALAQITGKPVRLLRFTGMTEEEVIRP
jgi:hypothetical protein